MSIHKALGPTPPPPPSACGESAAGAFETIAAETANGTLSPVGLLCDAILSAVNGLADCPVETAAQIANHVSGILAMASESREEARAMRDRIEKLKSTLRKKTVELTQLRRRHFGESSEKSPAEEGDIDLDSALIDLAPAEAAPEKPKGKRALRTSDAVKVIRKDHYPENRLCCTCGCEQKFIRSWDSKETVVVPEHVVMINHVYYQGVCGKQACKETGPNCQQAGRHIMKRKKLSLETVLTFAAQKHYEHSTNTRAGRRIRSQGIGHADSTLNRSAIHVASALAPIQEAMFDYVKAGEVVHADETPIRVQRQGAAKQKGKGRCDRFYIYAFLRDERKWNPDARPVVAFQARPSRSGATINELLSGTAIRHLQIDGYAGYNELFKADGRNHAMSPVRCWAHVRRKFEELSDSPLSKSLVNLIKGMYVVEKAAAYLPFAEREARRREQTLPIVTEIERLLQENRDAAQGKLKTAINYTLNSFEALQRFIFDGRLEIDNNPVERCIRGIALTRKNSLFAGSAGSADAWATYFTLIETAKLNGVDPHAYLQWAAGEIERNQGDVDYSMLMPWDCPTGRNQV